MPGFDRRGPTSMGPMTGGARGMCNPRGRYPTGRDFGSRFRGGRARSRDNRNMFGAPGQSSWRRSSPMSFRNGAFDTPISLEQEMGFLKD